MTDVAAAPAAVTRRRWIAAVLIVVALACALAAAPVFSHGMVANPFPSYVEGEPPYEVVRYSAPWIAGGIGLAGLAALLLVAAVVRLRRAVPVPPPAVLAEEDWLTQARRGETVDG